MPNAFVTTPLGPLAITADAVAVTAVHWGATPVTPGPVAERAPERFPESWLLQEAAAQLLAYVEGRLSRFDLPLAPSGTAFQRSVWDALADIPYGATETYAAVADRAGGSPRAVGGACGRNPIAVIIPCHRVLGGGGRLTGYSGGAGVVTKAALLALEARHAPAFCMAPPASRTIGNPA